MDEFTDTPYEFSVGLMKLYDRESDNWAWSSKSRTVYDKRQQILHYPKDMTISRTHDRFLPLPLLHQTFKIMYSEPYINQIEDRYPNLMSSKENMSRYEEVNLKKNMQYKQRFFQKRNIKLEDFSFKEEDEIDFREVPKQKVILTEELGDKNELMSGISATRLDSNIQSKSVSELKPSWIKAVEEKRPTILTKQKYLVLDASDKSQTELHNQPITSVFAEHKLTTKVVAECKDQIEPPLPCRQKTPPNIEPVKRMSRPSSTQRPTKIDKYSSTTNLKSENKICSKSQHIAQRSRDITANDRPEKLVTKSSLAKTEEHSSKNSKDLMDKLPNYNQTSIKQLASISGTSKSSELDLHGKDSLTLTLKGFLDESFNENVSRQAVVENVLNITKPLMNTYSPKPEDCCTLNEQPSDSQQPIPHQEGEEEEVFEDACSLEANGELLPNEDKVSPHPEEGNEPPVPGPDDPSPGATSEGEEGRRRKPPFMRKVHKQCVECELYLIKCCKYEATVDNLCTYSNTLEHKCSDYERVLKSYCTKMAASRIIIKHLQEKNSQLIQKITPGV